MLKPSCRKHRRRSSLQTCPPSRPCDKHSQHRHSWKVGSYLLPGRSRRLNCDCKSFTMSQLILLQDWQRGLIRSFMFPNEISEPASIKIGDQKRKAFPLHLACALQPHLNAIVVQAVSCSISIFPTGVAPPWKHRWWAFKKVRRRLNTSSGISPPLQRLPRLAIQVFTAAPFQPLLVETRYLLLQPRRPATP
jgi:hypothetical protein